MAGQWSEVGISRAPKISQVAIGHDGLHALLLSDDGVAYFTGTARRGEDGDQSKNRRQPKPVKPKKFSRVDGFNISYVACNNGSSALVSKDGALYIFGKDTTHADFSTGQVNDLKGTHITQVAVGKAHVVALSKNGDVYTFGMNNKGQCGREFSAAKESSSSNAAAVAAVNAVNEANADEPVSDSEGDQGGIKK